MQIKWQRPLNYRLEVRCAHSWCLLCVV